MGVIAMSSRFGTIAFALFLLTSLGRPATAHADGLVFWDPTIETSLNSALANDACRPSSPYALYRQTCVGNSLNITLERDPFERLTFLDHIALFVHKHKDLNTTTQIMPGIKFRLGVNLSNIYRQQAKLEARLRIHW
jgi:hypothetical protein